MKTLRQKIVWWAAYAASTFFIICSLAAPTAHAATGLFNDVCSQGGAGNSPVCNANGSNNLSGPGGVIVKVSNIFAFAAGVAGVGVLMISGYMYITANGDTNKTHEARSAMIYAIAGLVIIVVGRAIIGFVVTKF